MNWARMSVRLRVEDSRVSSDFSYPLEVMVRWRGKWPRGWLGCSECSINVGVLSVKGRFFTK